ncbi:YhdP family protein [Alkalilimnicola ehrlichii]|uniref:YhdP central domain-containing protein n=1 Tax=Alkalilimnicola ehrlichii TaxID=351052 RepID=A0A3E0X109_9GAMM|nr:AsmA-like C-terminal region-containing protein [Alkalilimnicola ehrlichii]RFA37857.1 hypothetical protein CAL65_07940 [Alkalilimnicola ehrlichii]
MFRLHARFDENGPAPLRVRYSDQLRALFQFAPEGGGISHAAIRLDNAAPVLPTSPGMHLRGRLSDLDLDQWHRTWKALQTAQSGSDASEGVSGGRGDMLPPLTVVDLHAGRVNAFGQRFSDVGISASTAILGWHLQLAGPELAGTVLIPKADSEQAVEIDLERLHLRHAAARLGNGTGERAASQPMDLKPRDMPPIRLSVEQALLNGTLLGQVDLNVSRVSDGLKLDHFALDGPVLRMSGNGAWRDAGGGDASSATHLQVRLETDKAGRAMDLFGQDSLLGGGRGEARLDLRWPGAPTDFALETVNGEVAFLIRNGHLLAVDPGAGRVFGLLSVTMLPRRLLLDFSDLFGRGFAFDQMASRMRLNNGAGELEYFYVHGPAARVEASGKLDFKHKTLDQVVVVTPRVSSALPIVGGLAGGPVGAVALFVTQRLLEQEIDSLTRYRYRVSGDWEEPAVERIGTSRPPPPPVPPADGGLPLPFSNGR